MPAHNERFGVMAAEAPRKRQCKFGREYPAGNIVEAATTPSRWDVRCNRANRQCIIIKKENKTETNIHIDKHE